MLREGKEERGGKGSGMLKGGKKKGVGYVESFSKCEIKELRQKFVACYLKKGI